MQFRAFTSPAAIYDRLTTAGHAESTAEQLAQRFLRAATALGKIDPDEEAVGFFVPGRIEVLGKHTDYAGGSSLTCATTQGFCLVTVPDASSMLAIVNADTGETVRFNLRKTSSGRAAHWSTYPQAVVRRVVQDLGRGASGRPLSGGAIGFSSTLPQAAGMSSSSAMVVAFFLALRALSDLEKRPAYQQQLSARPQVAAYLAAVESGRPYGPFAANEGVGTEGGSEDHTAILCAAPGTLRRFSYDPVRLHETVVLPDRWRFVIGVSGVTAEKTGAARLAYNSASRLAEEAARHWREQTGSEAHHLGALMRENGFSMDRFRQVIQAAAKQPEPLIRRAEHFHVENHVILPAAMQALKERDWTAFGTLVDRSQKAADTRLGNQVPETNHLTQSARRLGAVAASSFGAGFGGAVWALVAQDEVDAFQTAWRSDYQAHFPGRAASARFFTERPGPAAFQL